MTRHLFSHAVTVASALAGLAVGEFRRRVLLAQLRAARQAAVTDPLTGLVNRAGMAAHVGTALRAGPAGLLLIDLDSFKAVNDTHGHAAGDVVLVAVATRLRSALLPGEWAARHGGDEFSVLLTATS
ncbi:MAG TPA: GGDEF domain-containing protein, partial [Mycobacteriales bacterium]